MQDLSNDAKSELKLKGELSSLDEKAGCSSIFELIGKCFAARIVLGEMISNKLKL